MNMNIAQNQSTAVWSSLNAYIHATQTRDKRKNNSVTIFYIGEKINVEIVSQHSEE